MRILILGDSLACPMPRRGQPLEATWPALLRRTAPDMDIWHRARPRWCSLDVLAEFGLFTDSLSRFDALIVQVGIVDCGPRPYSYRLFKILEQCMSYERMRRLDSLAHRKFLWLRNRPWVTREQFKQNLAHIITTCAERNPALHVVFVPILPPTRRLLDLLPGIAQSAADYNKVFPELEREHPETMHALDPFSGQDPLQLTVEDGQHLTCLGHELIAAKLSDVLSPNSLHLP